jgi:hypothetical protein
VKYGDTIELLKRACERMPDVFDDFPVKGFGENETKINC